jgi:phenylalanyl-tRNA synthetase beta chain
MNLPLSWLDDYLKLGDITPKEYCDAMTMSGSMVEGYEELGKELTGVVVGKILTKVHHENADTLWVCTVDIGKEVIQIVTGAQNIEVGNLVPVATVGAHIPKLAHGESKEGGVTIKAGKLRGVPSNGMMCSHDELGLDVSTPGANPEGILILQKDYPLGEDIRKALNIGETVVEFEITSNRPDCLSVIGLARETAVTFGLPFSIPEVKVEAKADGNINDLLSVNVEEPSLCQRYIARIVKNIKIEPSPEWMQKRLNAAGVRAINNIVDITNYVMLEYGQPMHAFDLNYLEGGKINVRRAANGEKITTLDGQERILDDSMLMICDSVKPVAVAGVMGGENSDIKDDTKTVVFESATFLRGSVRVTAKKLGMRTEASSRYEKGLDPNMTLLAIERACQLIELLGAGEVMEGRIDVDNSDHTPHVLPFRPDYIRKFIGCDIDDEFMVNTLKALDFVVDTDKMELIVPSYRADVESSADVAEEIARIYGYDKIPATLLSGETTMGGRTYSQLTEGKIKELLCAQNCYEIMTYSFTSPKSLDMILAPDSLRNYIKITNPLGEDTSIMRTTTFSSMMEIMAKNYNRDKTSTVRFFEIGTIYIPKSLPLEELPDEKKIITIGGYGKMDFYDIKGIVEELFDGLGIVNYSFDSAERGRMYHPGKCAEIFINTKSVGIIGEVHPDVCENYDVEVPAFIAEIDYKSVLKASKREVKYKPLGKFPSVARDISLLVDDSVKVAEIEAIIKKSSGALLESIELFDVYKGAQIPEGKKSVSYTAIYRADNRTLKDTEIQKIFDKIIKNAETKLGAELR